MRIEMDSRFTKDLNKLIKKNPVIARRIKKKMVQVQETIGPLTTFEEVKKALPGLVKMVEHDDYYRLRVGKYRIGVELDAYVLFREATFIYVRVGSRAKFYNTFPPDDG